MPPKPSISFITVAMNRAHHLAITLPVNLRDNKAPGTEFVLLDYGSSDQLYSYISKTFPEHLASGSLHYHRVEADFFHRSHSRNVAARFASGDVICNIDADNFTGPALDSYLQDRFSETEKVFLTPLGHHTNPKDTLGKTACRKSDFISVGGYNENFEGYGFEDYDLVYRLEASGLNKLTITDQQYLQAIPHGTRERISNEWHFRNLKALYSQHVSTTTRVLLFLYKDFTLDYGMVIENSKGFRFSLAGGRWQKGHWSESESGLSLKFMTVEAVLTKQGDMLTGGNHKLKLETDTTKIEEAVLFNTEIANRYKLRTSQNLKPIT